MCNPQVNEYQSILISIYFAESRKEVITHLTTHIMFKKHYF